MSQFWTSIKEVRKNYKPYDEWEQQQADDVAKRAYLSKILDLPKDEVELTREKAEAVFRASDMMDKRSEDNCANMEQTTGLIGTALTMPAIIAIMAPLFIQSKGKPLSNQKQLLIQLGALFYTLAINMGVILWGNSKQKEASRIGRFQARQHELKNTKNFVLYTPEQIEAAKILAKNMKNKKDIKGLAKAFQDMKQMSVDKKAYKKWLQERIKNPEDIQKILNTEFTPEQMEQAEKDKEIIVNIIKDVNNSAETYSENVENMFDTVTLLSFITDIPLGLAVGKILKQFPKLSPTKSRTIQLITLALAPLGMLFWGTHAKKEASRVGRFTKRQEILNNPELVMAYTTEQLKLADNIKGKSIKKDFLQQLKDNFTFFGTYLKDVKNYEKYKKTTAKENEKLYEALGKIEVTEGQLKDAKHLQKSTFRAFDKMDEMSQRYSEDTEAATELAKEGLSGAISLISTLFTFGFAIAFLEGKLPVHKIAKSIAKFALKEDSPLRQEIEKAYETISKDESLKKDFCNMFLNHKAYQNVVNSPKLKGLFQEISNVFVKISEAKIKPESIENRQKLQALIQTEQIKVQEGTKTSEEAEKAIKEVLKKIDPAEDIQTIHSAISEHFKQGRISKWIQNFTAECAKGYLRKKTGYKPPVKESKDSVENILNSYKYAWKEYKTLVLTPIAILAPFSVITTALSWGFSSFLTNIQIKAGRIGIMKAMQEIDNAKLFVNAEEGNNEQ